jgi:hypothetical protein
MLELALYCLFTTGHVASEWTIEAQDAGKRVALDALLSNFMGAG